MYKLYVVPLLMLVLLFSCSKKEGNVKSDETKMSSAEILTEANQLFDQGNVEGAFRAYGIIYNNYPTSREYIDAVIGLSRCYNELGEFEKGMDLLLNLVQENIIPSRIPDIYNEMAKYYEVNAGISSIAGIASEEQDFEKAIQYYQKAIRYPNSEDLNAKSYAQYRIAELNIALHNFKDAALAFQSTVYSYPNTTWATRAEQRLVEFKNAVNAVLEEENTAVPPASPQPPASIVTEPSNPDNNAPEMTPPPVEENSPAGQGDKDTATDTMKTTEQDTSSKPQLDMK